MTRDKQKKRPIGLYIGLLCALFLCACGGGSSGIKGPVDPASATPTPQVTPVPDPGPAPKAGTSPVFDISTRDQGYIIVRYTKGNDKRHRVQIACNGEKQTFEIDADGDAEPITLCYGSGSYTLSVLENIVDNSYRIVGKTSFSVQLSDENLGFLPRSVPILYDNTMESVQKGWEEASVSQQDDEKAEADFDYVASTIGYDFSLIGQYQSGYRSDPETTYRNKRGICIDHSVLLASMLRSMGIPCKVVEGTADGIEGYHAWNSVYLNGEWVLMDASAAAQGGKGANYIPYKAY